MSAVNVSHYAKLRLTHQAVCLEGTVRGKDAIRVLTGRACVGRQGSGVYGRVVFVEAIAARFQPSSCTLPYMPAWMMCVERKDRVGDVESYLQTS
jgi:hypothetical protein